MNYEETAGTLMLSHPRGFCEGKQSKLVGWFSTVGLVIIQSHVSPSVPGVLQISTDQKQREGE